MRLVVAIVALWLAGCANTPEVSLATEAWSDVAQGPFLARPPHVMAPGAPGPDQDTYAYLNVSVDRAGEVAFRVPVEQGCLGIADWIRHARSDRAGVAAAEVNDTVLAVRFAGPATVVSLVPASDFRARSCDAVGFPTGSHTKPGLVHASSYRVFHDVWADRGLRVHLAMDGGGGGCNWGVRVAGNLTADAWTELQSPPLGGCA